MTGRRPQKNKSHRHAFISGRIMFRKKKVGDAFRKTDIVNVDVAAVEIMFSKRQFQETK